MCVETFNTILRLRKILTAFMSLADTESMLLNKSSKLFSPWFCAILSNWELAFSLDNANEALSAFLFC